MNTSGAKSNRSSGGMGGFWALIATQFQGAFNDQFLQFLVQFTVVAVLTAPGLEPAESTSFNVVSLATIIFSLPFLIFPGIAGALSDRYSKRTVAIAVKGVEILFMLFAVAAFATRSPFLLFAILFLMASHSAFFSPAKYGILPEILPESKLSWGNGILQMGTIVAIISGAGLAGPAFDTFNTRLYIAPVFLLGLTLIGLATAQFIARVPAANPLQRVTLNPWAGTLGHFKALRRDRWLLYSVIGYTYFWFAGTLLRENVFTFGRSTLHLSAMQVSLTVASLTFGIGAGALCAGYLSRNKIELGLVPIGTLGIAVFSGILAIPGVGPIGYSVLLFFLGYFAGFFDVPLAATVQQRSPDDIKGGMMATTNMLTFVGMLVAGGLYFLLGWLHVSTHAVFFLSCVLSLVIGVWLCYEMPVMFLRALTWLVFTLGYRVRVTGAERFPREGGTLILSNHISYLDPGIIYWAVDRPIRFTYYRAFHSIWLIRWFANMLDAIPVAATDGPEALRRSLKKATDVLNAGEALCVFPEGGITRTGQLLSFQRGYERVLKNANPDVRIVPVYIDNMWGSNFSYSGGHFFRKWPSFRPRITVSFGAPMPASSTPFEVRTAMKALETEAYGLRKPKDQLLHRMFVKMVRRHPGRMAVVDARTGALSYFKTYVASIILARKLKRQLGKEPMVGLLVPPSVGGGLANIALQIMGRVPINLNYTTSPANLASAARQCKMTHCITARAFLERLPVEVPGTPIYLEDIMKSVTKKDRIVALLLAVLCPVRVVELLVGSPTGRSNKDLATIIFSSGSEGDPKGVVLTHYNVLSNIECFAQVFPNKPGDPMVAFLPFFHSFGFTGTFWAPITHGLSSVFHPSPLETKAIGDLIFKYKAKFLIATPTFLQNFTRRCAPEDLASLSFVVCGAEKLTPRIRDAFKEKFGKEPFDGYGTTECSPVVALNVPDVPLPDLYMRGTKRGSVGRPLPSISVRVIDPETGEVLPPNQPGILQIRGPNVMQGYMNMPEKTAEVLKDGWYASGDIATVDDEGFITITDRLARFSKIAGEMISHSRIEEALHSLLGLTEQSLAVAGVPDNTRGERIVVLHTLSDEQIQELMDKLDSSNLSNLARPRRDSFHRIEAIPVLGTGKMDIKAVKTMAAELDQREQ